jgi:hypothetical protein
MSQSTRFRRSIVTIVRKRDNMAKHAKHSDNEYTVNITEVSYGFAVVEAESQAEAMRIARDIYEDRTVSWASQTVSFTPEVS